MKRYFLSSGAKASLTDIYVYTYEKWGSVQADHYLDGLYDTFERIVRKEGLWRPIPAEFEIEGYFTRYEKHLIYWKCFEDEEIGIVAISHTSMLQGDRLTAAFGLLPDSG